MDRTSTTPFHRSLAGLAACALLALLVTGCQPGDRPPAAAPSEAAEAQPAKDAAAAAAQAHTVLSAAIAEAADMDLLRRGFVRELPKPSDADLEQWKTWATAADGSPAGRLAARVALGATADPERIRAIGAWLQATRQQLSRTGRFDTADVVEIVTSVHPQLKERVAALPPPIAERIRSASPGDLARWTAAVEAHPLPALTAADMPALLRMGFGPRGTGRLAWLLLALLDDPAVTEALLTVPTTRLTDPDQRADLIEWALRLHTVPPENRARLVAAIDPTASTRDNDRATTVLSMWKDPAAVAGVVKLTRIIVSDPKNNLPPDISLRAFIEILGDWPEPTVQASLAGYGQSAAPHRGLAKRAARASRAKPPKEMLIERVQRHPHDGRARFELIPMLTADDAPVVAELLSDTRWSKKGFFQWVRMLERVDPAVLTGPVVGNLQAVIDRHPQAQVKEWALGVLGRAPGDLDRRIKRAADRGSIAATRAVIRRADDPWSTLWARLTGRSDPVRRAAYEVLIAPAQLPFKPDAEQTRQLVEHTAQHLSARPEDPWLFLRAMQLHVAQLAPADRPRVDQQVVSALEPYCLSGDPQNKPRWEALFAVRDLQTPAARALLDKAIASVPTEEARGVMKVRLGLTR